MFKKVATYIIGIALVAAVTAIINNHMRSSGNSKVLLSMASSMQEMAVSMDQISEQNQALILLATFRTDPWSGKMAAERQDRLYDLLVEKGFKIAHGEMPDIKQIQRDLAPDLIPPDFFETFSK